MEREKVKSRDDPIFLQMRNELVAGGPGWHHEIKDMVCVLAMGRGIRQADAKTLGPGLQRFVVTRPQQSPVSCRDVSALQLTPEECRKYVRDDIT